MLPGCMYGFTGTSFSMFAYNTTIYLNLYTHTFIEKFNIYGETINIVLREAFLVIDVKCSWEA